MTAPSLAEQIACIRREIAMRERVYPRQIAAGRMKQAAADRELAAMRAVLASLDALEQSVRLQSHYAALLNSYDGGRRLEFASADEWLARLSSISAPPQDGAAAASNFREMAIANGHDPGADRDFL